MLEVDGSIFVYGGFILILAMLAFGITLYVLEFNCPIGRKE